MSGDASGTGGVTGSGDLTGRGGATGIAGNTSATAGTGGSSAYGGSLGSGGSAGFGGSSGYGGSAGFGGSSGYGGSTGSGGGTRNSGSDGSAGAGGEAGVVDGTAADGATSSGERRLPCGQMTCNTADPTQAVCCMDYPAATATIPHYSCVAAASACRDTTGGWTVSVTCGGSANCKDPAKPVCCAFMDANGNYSDECHSDCIGGVELRGCLWTSDCPEGELCEGSQCVEP